VISRFLIAYSNEPYQLPRFLSNVRDGCQCIFQNINFAGWLISDSLFICIECAAGCVYACMDIGMFTIAIAAWGDQVVPFIRAYALSETF